LIGLERIEARNVWIWSGDAKIEFDGVIQMFKPGKIWLTKGDPTESMDRQTRPITPTVNEG